MSQQSLEDRAREFAGKWSTGQEDVTPIFQAIFDLLVDVDRDGAERATEAARGEVERLKREMEGLRVELRSAEAAHVAHHEHENAEITRLLGEVKLLHQRVADQRASLDASETLLARKTGRIAALSERLAVGERLRARVAAMATGPDYDNDLIEKVKQSLRGAAVNLPLDVRARHIVGDVCHHLAHTAAATPAAPVTPIEPGWADNLPCPVTETPCNTCVGMCKKMDPAPVTPAEPTMCGATIGGMSGELRCTKEPGHPRGARPDDDGHRWNIGDPGAYQEWLRCYGVCPYMRRADCKFNCGPEIKHRGDDEPAPVTPKGEPLGCGYRCSKAGCDEPCALPAEHAGYHSCRATDIVEAPPSEPQSEAPPAPPVPGSSRAVLLAALSDASAPTVPGGVTCSECGTVAAKDAVSCMKCGNGWNPGKDFCSECDCRAGNGQRGHHMTYVANTVAPGQRAVFKCAFCPHMSAPVEASKAFGIGEFERRVVGALVSATPAPLSKLVLEIECPHCHAKPGVTCRPADLEGKTGMVCAMRINRARANRDTAKPEATPPATKSCDACGHPWSVHHPEDKDHYPGCRHDAGDFSECKCERTGPPEVAPPAPCPCNPEKPVWEQAHHFYCVRLNRAAPPAPAAVVESRLPKREQPLRSGRRPLEGVQTPESAGDGSGRGVSPKGCATASHTPRPRQPSSAPAADAGSEHRRVPCPTCEQPVGAWCIAGPGINTRQIEGEWVHISRLDAVRSASAAPTEEPPRDDGSVYFAPHGWSIPCKDCGSMTLEGGKCVNDCRRGSSPGSKEPISITAEKVVGNAMLVSMEDLAGISHAILRAHATGRAEGRADRDAVVSRAHAAGRAEALAEVIDVVDEFTEPPWVAEERCHGRRIADAIARLSSTTTTGGERP